MDAKILKDYWAANLATLPTKADKSPDVKGTWKGGINDVSQYIGSNGLGIICGATSFGVECLDFDNHFGDAKDNISAFIEQVRDIYTKHKLPVESTLNGGFHLIYRCDTIEGNQKLAQKPVYDEATRKFKPDVIIETRGEGGYFVAAPTPGYKVIRNSLLDIPTITKQERAELLNVARSFNQWYELTPFEFEQKDRPGDMFNQDVSAQAQSEASLKQHGWQEIRPQIWRRPDKKDGISATFGKAAKGIFYNFSSSAYPFEPQKGYTPFQIIALLDYNGDFKRFATELAEKYGLEKPITKEYAKKEPKKIELTELQNILNKSYIDFSIPVEKPPIAIKVINHETNRTIEQRLFTIGNFSAITGKSKAKKTFLSTLLMAASASGSVVQNKLIGTLPKNKKAVILFDTEQSNYDAWESANRVNRLLGYIPENFGAFDLREFDPMERCQIIEYTLEKFKGSIGYMVIDGIADLAKAINDEEEAIRVCGLLMRWTKEYQCHINTIIHQNKNDNFATGHLGSYIMKKCECIISVTKDADEPNRSTVNCDMIRGVQDFNEFDIEITENGLPYVVNSKFNRPTNDAPY